MNVVTQALRQTTSYDDRVRIMPGDLVRTYDDINVFKEVYDPYDKKMTLGLYGQKMRRAHVGLVLQSAENWVFVLFFDNRTSCVGWVVASLLTVVRTC